MTKKQKTELIAQLKEIAVKNGFILDRWGNYKSRLVLKNIGSNLRK